MEGVENANQDIVNYLDNNYKPAFDYNNIRVTERRKINNGDLARVIIYDGGPEKSIWVWKDKRCNFKYFSTSENLLQFLHESQKYQLIDKLTDGDTFSAILALILVVAIIALAIVKSSSQIDPLLGSILTLVVGFYFGKKN